MPMVIDCPLYDEPRKTMLTKLSEGLPEPLAACGHTYDLYGMVLSPLDQWHFKIVTRFLMTCIGLRTMASAVLLEPAAPLPKSMSTGMRELPWIRTTTTGPASILAAIVAALGDAPGQPRIGSMAQRMASPEPVWLEPAN